MAEPPGGLAGEAGEPFGEIRCCDAASLGDPDRQSEVQQGDHRRDARGPQKLQQLTVPHPGGLVPDTLTRLDPAPLDGEAVGVRPEPGHQAHVLGHPVPVVHRSTAALTTSDVTGLLLEAGPIVVIAALDLVRGGGGAPKEAGGPGRKRRRQFLGREDDRRLLGAEVKAGRDPRDHDQQQQGHDRDGKLPLQSTLLRRSSGARLAGITGGRRTQDRVAEPWALA